MSRCTALVFAALLIMSLSVSGSARAAEPEPAKVTVRHEELMRAFHDGKGNILVVPDGSALRGRNYKVKRQLQKQVFFGSRKKLYRQRQRGFSRNGTRYQISVLDPRARQASHSFFVRDPAGRTYFQCQNRKVGLSPLSTAETRRLLKTAQFRDVYWNRQIHLVARDDTGRYFFADRLRYGLDERAGRTPWPRVPRGLRLWSGRRGKMKRIGLRDTVADSAGQILIAKQGRLKITLKNYRPIAAEWLQPVPKAKGRCAKCACPCAGKVHRQKLTMVDVLNRANSGGVLLVYKQLGPYLGVKLRRPCDVW
jgi:hypothetical protein